MDSDSEPKGRMSTAGQSAYEESVDVVLTFSGVGEEKSEAEGGDEAGDEAGEERDDR